MSGGAFNYYQHHIDDIRAEIEDYLYGHDLDEWETEDYIRDYFIDEDEATAYIRKHNHTFPNPCGYSKETVKELKKAVQILKQASVYAQRIDWLLSGDDGEETFHERLKDELQTLKHSERQ